MRGRAAPPHPGIYRVPPPGDPLILFNLDSSIQMTLKKQNLTPRISERRLLRITAMRAFFSTQGRLIILESGGVLCSDRGNAINKTIIHRN